MHIDNIEFTTETGGNAIERMGYSIRSLKENAIVPYSIHNPDDGGLQIKSHYTIVDNNNPKHFKSVTEFLDGTATIQSARIDANGNPYQITRVKDIDGKWHLLNYDNKLMNYCNGELYKPLYSLNDIPNAENLTRREQRKLLYKMNARIPTNNVNLEFGIYPKISNIQADGVERTFFINWSRLKSLSPNEAIESIYATYPKLGLTKNEADTLGKLFSSEISTEGRDLIKLGKSFLTALKRIHI